MDPLQCIVFRRRGSRLADSGCERLLCSAGVVIVHIANPYHNTVAIDHTRSLLGEDDGTLSKGKLGAAHQSAAVR